MKIIQRPLDDMSKNIDKFYAHDQKSSIANISKSGRNRDKSKER